MENELELSAVIGFKGTVPSGLILHPDNEHLIFPLGCTVVVRNLIKKTQAFFTGSRQPGQLHHCLEQRNASGIRTEDIHGLPS
jgi:hypothetical protein